MRQIAILGRQAKSLMPDNRSIGTVEIDGLPVTCGLVLTPDVDFDPQQPESRQRIWVRIKAFSCNYRDKELICLAARKGPGNAFLAFGSDFIGEIACVGAEVVDFQVGDRVIGNNHYTGALNGGFSEGIPTMHASKEYQAFHPGNLIKIPPQMSDEVAASFSIGAQTVYSVLRKANLTPGCNVLVMSAKSNTALFALNALKKYAVNVFATTTSLGCERELARLGVQRLFQVDRDLATFQQQPELFKQALEVGGFDVVIDPFFDLHLGKVIDLMVAGGRYLTCGAWEQYQSGAIPASRFRGKNLFAILIQAVVKNIQIIGNCLGRTEDLCGALRDYVSGDFNVIVDSVFTGDQVAAFLERTYVAKDRLGKVIYRYA